jgi:hypothetical protein
MLHPNPDSRMNAHEILETFFIEKKRTRTSDDAIFGKLQKLPEWKDYKNPFECRKFGPMSSALANFAQTVIKEYASVFIDVKKMSSRVFYQSLYLWWYCYLSYPTAKVERNAKAYLYVCFELCADFFNENSDFYDILDAFDFFSGDQLPKACFKGLRSKVITILEGRIWFPSFFCTWQAKMEDWNVKREKMITDNLLNYIEKHKRFPPLQVLEESYESWLSSVKQQHV